MTACGYVDFHLYSVLKVQGGRFFVIKLGDFSMLKLI